MKIRILILFIFYLHLFVPIFSMQENDQVGAENDFIQAVKLLNIKLAQACKNKDLIELSNILEIDSINGKILFFSIIYQDENERNLLFKCVLSGNINIVKKVFLAFVSSTTDINSAEAVLNLLHKLIDQADIHGITPLMAVSAMGLEDIALMLIKQFNVNVNKQDYLGSTALMHAVGFNHTKLLLLLLENGADINIKNNLNDTAYDIAIKLNLNIVVQILLQHIIMSKPRTLIKEQEVRFQIPISMITNPTNPEKIGSLLNTKEYYSNQFEPYCIEYECDFQQCNQIFATSKEHQEHMDNFHKENTNIFMLPKSY